MVVTQARSRRKPSGGLHRSTLTKRTHMLGRVPAMTKVGNEERKNTIQTKGGNTKHRIFETQTVNLIDGKKHTKAKISAVTESPANRNFVRRNILVKGTIIETDKGQARITNRPGQDGIVNAVLVK